MKYKQNKAGSVHFKVLILILVMIVIFLCIGSVTLKLSAQTSTGRINFDFPFNTTINLGVPFLVEYDNTTGLKPIGIRTTDIGSEDFEVTFSGFGFINNSNDVVKYNSNGSGIYITDPTGIVYQKGIIEFRTERGNDTAIARYESVGDQAGEERIIDSGILFFNSSSSDGELSFLNNTVAVYKDILGIGGSNITTIAWRWN